VPVSFPFVAKLFNPCLSIEIFTFVLMLTDFYALLLNFSGVCVLHTDVTILAVMCGAALSKFCHVYLHR